MSTSEPVDLCCKCLKSRKGADVIRQREFGLALRSVGQCRKEADALTALHDIRKSLGAEQALFMTFIHGRQSAAGARLLSDCDPRWCLDHSGAAMREAWATYAAYHSEPLAASKMAGTEGDGCAGGAGGINGAASVYVAPAPSAHRARRSGVLVMGHHDANHFEAVRDWRLRTFARAAAMELNEWWSTTLRRRFFEQSNLTSEEWLLLRLTARGLRSREIGRQLGVSPTAIDNKFQRLNSRLGTQDRRESAQLILEFAPI